MRPDQRKTKMVELNFGEVVICMLCQLLSDVVGIILGGGGIEHRSLTLYLL